MPDKDIDSKLREQQFMYLPPPTTEKDEKFQPSPKIDKDAWPSLLAKKFSRNPFVPLGLSVSVVAMVRGAYFGLVKKNSAVSNKMMQFVVGGQLLTFGSILIEKNYTAYKRQKELATEQLAESNSES